MKRHPVVYLKDYVAATRITSSQARHVSWIYNRSPLDSWATMFKTVFPEPEFNAIRETCIRDFVARNYVGLVQIRNYGSYFQLLREIGYLLKYRPGNVFSPAFWFFSLGCAVMPPALLIPLVDWYKYNVHRKTMAHVEFDYKLA